MPGVPPNALDNLKRAFKGLFKRSKKSNASTTTTTSAATSQAPQSAAGSQAAPPPQLPPIQHNSPLGDTSKPLPPTHPLATGQHEQPMVAVPPKRDANPGPPAPIVGPAVPPKQVEEPRRETTTSPISPPEPHSAVDGARSGDVSAVTNESSPQSPEKTDSGIEEVKTEQPREPAVTSAQPTTDATKLEPIDTTTPTEDIPASSPAPASASAAAPNGHPALPPTAPSDQPATPEEKVAIMHDEPPPIPAAKSAPGMSATSGPLEDFPEGGYL